MKKETKPPRHGKEIAGQPFSGLKSFQIEGLASLPTPTSRPEQHQAEAGDEDIGLFYREMAGVRRLEESLATGVKSGDTVAAAAVNLSRFEEQEQQLFLDALRELDLDMMFRDGIPTTGSQARPLRANRLRQLKSGAIRITCELDLHGMTRDEAVKSLAYFISGACNRGQKAVLVITGKGNNSPDEPVLISAVAGWLREKGKGMVAEFAHAPRRMGGKGAFVVFLKSKGKPGEKI
ncbi:MAG: Smr/MutS family protein [Geobacteraceae bacterium]